jgi:Zn-finger nucleic acid-binding protein
MRCPRDRAALVAQGRQVGVLAACPSCDGLWVSAAARRVRPEAIEARVPAAARRVRARAPGGSATGGPCPACGARLAGRRVEGIVLDACAACGGVWLDAGEFDAVRVWLAQAPTAPTAARRPSGSGGLLRAAGEEAAEEVIFAALGRLLRVLAP